MPKDYKPQYKTYDGVNVSPDDEVFVCVMEDLEQWVPRSMTARQAEKSGNRIYYSTYEACINDCEDGNLYIDPCPNDF